MASRPPHGNRRRDEIPARPRRLGSEGLHKGGEVSSGPPATSDIGESSQASGGDGWKSMKSMPGQSWAGQSGSGGHRVRSTELTLGRDRIAWRNHSKPMLPLAAPGGRPSLTGQQERWCSLRDAVRKSILGRKVRCLMC